ncbi:MAG: exodeoxyribonuclease VII small subunit [Chloroflexi bacterium]|nr:exodeoxyribonuclease VII small subunit [Chloroflexota bacterium]
MVTDRLDFEQALAELEAVVERLQRPDIPLQEAVALYRRGTELAARSEALLSQAELQVQQLTRAVQERFAEYGALDEESAAEPDA